MLVVMMLGGTVGAGAQPQQAPERTDIRLFVPFQAGRLVSGLTVAARISGKCFAPSLASQGRADAWRCSAGNLILDPCYESIPSAQPLLACPTSPWQPQVRLLAATGIPHDQANPGTLTAQLPWALELADGSRCQFLTGATTAVAGMRLNYGCANGVSVVGTVDRSQPLWRVFVLPQSGPAVRQVDVTVAWY